MSNILNIGLEPFQLMRDINGIAPEDLKHQPFTDINQLLLSSLSSSENVQNYYSIPESYRNSYSVFNSTDSPTTFPTQSPNTNSNQPLPTSTAPQPQSTASSSSKSKNQSPSLQVTPPTTQQYSSGQLSPRLSNAHAHILPQLQQQFKQQSQAHLQAQQMHQAQLQQAQMQQQAQQHLQHQLHQQAQMHLQHAHLQQTQLHLQQQAQVQQQQRHKGSPQQVPQMYNPAAIQMQQYQQSQQMQQPSQQTQQAPANSVQAQLLQHLQQQRQQHQQQQQQYQQQYPAQSQQQQSTPPQVKYNSSPPQQQVPSRPSSPTPVHLQRSPSPSAPLSPPNQHSHSTPAPQQYPYGSQHPVPVSVQLHSQFQPQLLAPHALPNTQAIQQYQLQQLQQLQQAQVQAQPVAQPTQSKHASPVHTTHASKPAPPPQKAVTPPPPVQQFLSSVSSPSDNSRPPSPTPLEPLSPTVYQFISIKDEQDPNKMRPLTEKQKNRRRASQNLASRNYRQRKKEYITTMEERASDLEKDMEELRRLVNNKDLIISKLTEENLALRASGSGSHIPTTDIDNIDLEDAGPMDSNMQELVMKLESTLIMSEDKSEEETDVASLQETLKMFYGSLQQRHERYTEQVKEIVNPCTQAKLSALDADPTSPFDNGFTENDDAWWAAFSADAKITEEQTVKIKQVRHDHFLEFQRLRNERRGLNKDIREYYKMVFSGKVEEDEENDVKMEQLVEKLSALKQNLENEKVLILQTHSAMASILSPKQEAILVTRSYNKVVRSNATIQMVTSMYGVLLKESALAKCCAPGWDM